VNNHEWFRNICHKNAFQISENNLTLLKLYVDLLIEWNQKINLISRQDMENIWSRHILGSVSFLFKNNLSAGTSIVDLGTGGGLPGIPIAILREDLHLLLIDSIQKKISAVNDILGKLELNRVTALAGRAEEVGKKKEYFQKYDYLIARAVAPISDILLWGRPFLKKIVSRAPEGSPKEFIPPGSIVLLKGGNLSAEIESARIKQNPISITERLIVIDGVDATSDPFDKKIVIVQP
jgi:16S rRNA (guanine527-N7)-methyltransferase